MFLHYQKNPVLSSAHKVAAEDSIVEIKDLKDTYSLSASDGTHVIFNSHHKVKVGDYLVYAAIGISRQSAKQFEDNHSILEENI